MGFGQAISTGFRKYVNFSGRARRSEYWYWVLFSVIVGFVAAIVDMQLNTQLNSSIANLVIAIPSIAVAVRRLHDIDRSGWWVLIGLVPLVGFILLVVWFASEGTHGPNRFGPDPLDENPVPNQQFGAPA
jgi:uncharacterized membrane protein YhaH (DUF805 family)